MVKGWGDETRAVVYMMKSIRPRTDEPRRRYMTKRNLWHLT